MALPIPDKDTLALILKYGGVPALIAVGLVIFLAQVIYAQQAETLKTITQHQTESQISADKQLRVLQLICAAVSETDAQRQWCFILNNQPGMAQ